jgi:phospholipase/carboxylesterase
MAEFVEGPMLAALSCGKPVYLVVLLPGAGADGQAMLDLALGWAPAMPKADFLVADSGDFAETDPNFADRAAALDGFLDAMLAKRRLPASHLALVGFSEGARVALHTGVARRDRIAAIVALSAVYDSSPPPALGGESPPILLVHGDADSVSPYPAMLEAKAALKQSGAQVWSFKRPGLGHALDDEGIAAAGDFLCKNVVHKATAEDHAHS